MSGPFKSRTDRVDQSISTRRKYGPRGSLRPASRARLQATGPQRTYHSLATDIVLVSLCPPRSSRSESRLDREGRSRVYIHSRDDPDPGASVVDLRAEGEALEGDMVEVLPERMVVRGE